MRGGIGHIVFALFRHGTHSVYFDSEETTALIRLFVVDSGWFIGGDAWNRGVWELRRGRLEGFRRVQTQLGGGVAFRRVRGVY